MPITVRLSQRRWAELVALVQTPAGPIVGEAGGYQARRLRLNAAMDTRNRSVTLGTEGFRGPTNRWNISDVEIIQRAIRRHWKGGWQGDLNRIFNGAHPLFTGIKPDPRE